MTKEEVQKRVLRNGKPIALDEFMWDEKTRTFSSQLNCLVLDFTAWDDCTFTTGYGCTFTTRYDCTFTTGYGCTFKTGDGCTFTTWSGCTFTTGDDCTFTTGDSCTFKTGYGCTFKTGSGCMFKTWDGCTFTTLHNCTFTTGGSCTFKTGSCCTFTTGHGCTFTAGYGCTFKTGSGCIWKHTWGETNFPLIRFCGSHYFIECSAPGTIRSGCIEKSVDWWLENVTRCAEEHHYPPDAQKEYALYVRLIAEWMTGNGLMKVKPELSSM